MGHSVWTSKRAKVGQRVHIWTYDKQHSGWPMVSAETIAKVEQEMFERLAYDSSRAVRIDP